MQKSVSRIEIIEMIRRQELKPESRGYSLPAPKNYYGFLTSEKFDWENYLEKTYPELEITESPVRRKEFLIYAVVFGIQGIIYTCWLYSHSIMQGSISLILFSVITLLFLVRYFRNPKVLLKINKDGISVKKHHIPYRSIIFAYFKFIIYRGTLTEMLIFVDESGTKHSLDLQSLGYTKQMIGRIVYTKIKQAEQKSVSH